MDNISNLKTYYICDHCKRILRFNYLEPYHADYTCRCGRSARQDNSLLLNDLDSTIRGFGGSVAYYFYGSIEKNGDEYMIHTPMMRYRDARSKPTISHFIQNYICDKGGPHHRYNLMHADNGMIDLSCFCNERCQDEIEAINILSEYRCHFDDFIGWICSTLDEINKDRREQAKKKAEHSFGMALPIRDTKKYYYCPECGNIGCIETDTHWSERMIEQHGNFTSSVVVHEPIITNSVKCVECDDYMVELDADIALSIKKMNDLGIVTTYCCQGHYVNEHFFRLPNKSDGEDNYCVDHHIDLSYVSFFANNRDNEELVNIVADIAVNTDKYPHIRVDYIDEYHNPSPIFDMIYICTDVDEISEEAFNASKTEFIEFLGELIEKYGKVKQ